MKYYIITGTSRGLGEALVQKLIREENTIFCISRTENQNLTDSASKNNCSLFYYSYDLTDIPNITKLIDDIFSHISIENAEAIYLINNAGIVAPIKIIDHCENLEISKNININLVAPMVLVSEFIKRTTAFPISKRIINISSGAGKKPYHGWSAYCSAKAGLDLFTQTVAMEENEKKHPVEILSLAPGIIDTTMQKEIRETKEENFKLLNDFINFKESGKLLPPEEVAGGVLKALYSDEFQQGGITHVKNFLD